MERDRFFTSIQFWIGLGLFAVVLIWFLPWRFQVNDDEVMMWLVSGAYTGSPEAYAVFLHPYLSVSFSALYSWIPMVPWYPLIWFALLFLSYALLIESVRIHFGSSPKRMIWNLLLLAVLIHFAFFLQFSIVAAFCITAGMIYRSEQNRNTSRRAFNLFPSDLLLLVGILIRWEVGVVLIVGGFGLMLVFGREKTSIRASVLPLLFLALALVTHTLWIKRAGLEQFSDLNRLRSQVFDHPMLQLQKEYWMVEEPELYHFSNGLQDFQSGELGEKTLLDWKEKLDSSRYEFISPRYFIRSWVTFVRHEHFFLYLLATLLALVFLEKKKSMLWSLFSIFLGFWILAPFYLLKIQVFVLAFFLILFLQFHWESPKVQTSIRIYKGIGGMLILGIAWHLTSLFSSGKNIPENFEIREVLTELKGVTEVYLIGENKWYHSLVFENPLPFRVLGWSSLLESVDPKTISGQKAFLVQNKTYFPNEGYFQKGNPSIRFLEEFVLITYP
ncbi:hypothetical protein [Algoriphagus mannitolivorans]|uniref:hypothetical protein n=1 Tax=Algoriphagus mannitolivorans TaxID=226504 RepID=UPI00041268E6|nr:hypothetical protein [Algoriphagus mannitolivorans]